MFFFVNGRRGKRTPDIFTERGTSRSFVAYLSTTMYHALNVSQSYFYRKFMRPVGNSKATEHNVQATEIAS